MPSIAKLFLGLGSASAGVAVVLGASATHGLKSVLSARKLEVFHTAVDYQMTHSLAIMLVGLWLLVLVHRTGDKQVVGKPVANSKALKLGGWSFVAGVLCFCGSLYALAFADQGLGFVGLITPLGGLFLICGWLALVVQAWRQ